MAKSKDELQKIFSNITPGLTPIEQAQLDQQTAKLKEDAILKAKKREAAEKHQARTNEYIEKVKNLVVEDLAERDRLFRALKAQYVDVNPDSLRVYPPVPDVERLAAWIEEVPRDEAMLLLIAWPRLSPEEKKFINGQFTSGKQAAKQAISTFIKSELRSMGWKETINLKETPPEAK